MENSSMIPSQIMVKLFLSWFRLRSEKGNLSLIPSQIGDEKSASDSVSDQRWKIRLGFCLILGKKNSPLIMSMIPYQIRDETQKSLSLKTYFNRDKFFVCNFWILKNKIDKKIRDWNSIKDEKFLFQNPSLITSIINSNQE